MALAEKKLIDIPKEYLMVMMEAGYVLLAMRKLSEAEEIFEGVSHLAPKSAVPLIALGNVYAAQQQIESAAQYYRKALKREENSAMAHAFLGEALILQENPEAARKHLGLAIEGDDTDGKAAIFAKALLDALDQGVLPFPKVATRQKTPVPPRPKLPDND